MSPLPTCVRWPLALVMLAALWGAAPLVAQEGGAQIVLTVGEMKRGDAEALAEAVAPAGAAGDVHVEALEASTLLGTLRGELLRARRRQLLSDPCPAQAPSLEEASAQARRELSFFKLEDASRAFDDAVVALRCGTEVPTSQDLAALMMTGALIAAFEGENPRGRFRAALAADPSVKMEAGMPAEVMAAFSEVQAEALRRQVVLASVPAGATDGLGLVVDGRWLQGPPTLSPGLHLVQLATAEGIAVGGEFVTLESGGSPPLLVAALIPPTPLELASTLAQGIAAGRLSPSAEAAAEATRRQSQISGLAFATHVDGGAGGLRGVLLTARGSERMSIQTRGRGSVDAGALVRSAAVPTLVSVAVVGGLLYGAAAVTLNRWPVDDYSGDADGYAEAAQQVSRVRALGHGALAVGLGGAVGAGAVIGLRLRKTTVKAAAGVSPVPGGVMIAGGLSW